MASVNAREKLVISLRRTTVSLKGLLPIISVLVGHVRAVVASRDFKVVSPLSAPRRNSVSLVDSCTQMLPVSSNEKVNDAITLKPAIIDAEI